MLAPNPVLVAKLILAFPLLAVFAALVAWLLGRRPGTVARVTWLGVATRLLSALSLGCSLLVAAGQTGRAPLQFKVFWVDFYLDGLSVYFLLLVNLVAFFASWYSVQFLRFDAQFGDHYEPEVFHIFFNLFHFTMLVVPMVDNLIVLWMAIELTTLASTVLVRYHRRRESLEAAWKYIIITTAGIVFALFGTIFLADAIPASTPANVPVLANRLPMNWSVLAIPDVARALTPKLVLLSFLFVLVGYGTKAGFAPMHTWLPDGHGEAPSPVSALLSGVLLKSALYAILRFTTITNLNQGNTRFTSTALLATGLLSLVLATPFILKTNRFKRVLAYHSLEHMGIIAFGLGIGGELALFGALLHALNHALTKALMFLTFDNIRREYAAHAGQADLDESHITGVWRAMPVSGLILLLGGLGLVGSPPFNIFLSEFIIVWAALRPIVNPGGALGGDPGALAALSPAVYVGAIVLFLVSVTLIFGGLVVHIARRLLGRPRFQGMTDHLSQSAWLLVLLFVIILFGVWIPTVPVDFPRLLTESVRILRQGAPHL